MSINTLEEKNIDKMKKFKYNIGIAIMCVMVMITSCDQDDSVPDIPRENSTSATVVEESITVSEGGDPTFTIQQEGLIEARFDEAEAFYEVSGQVGIRVVGGTAVEGVDYDFTIITIQDFSPFLLQDGYYYEYDATTSLTNNVSGIITVYSDGVSEGSETIELQFFPVGLGSIIIDDTLTITIND
jgi:hypothetical protein